MRAQRGGSEKAEVDNRTAQLEHELSSTIGALRTVDRIARVERIASLAQSHVGRAATWFRPARAHSRTTQQRNSAASPRACLRQPVSGTSHSSSSHHVAHRRVRQRRAVHRRIGHRLDRAAPTGSPTPQATARYRSEAARSHDQRQLECGNGAPLARLRTRLPAAHWKRPALSACEWDALSTAGHAVARQP